MIKVKKWKFIQWYFADKNMKRDIAQKVQEALDVDGEYSLTVEELFDTCGYIPNEITESAHSINTQFDDEIEYTPNECELID